MRRTRYGRERGAALVELAVTLPVLVLIAVGTTDLARAYRTATALTSAARAGALYGGQEAAFSVDTAGMTTAAQNVLSANLSGATSASATRLCECISASGTVSATSPANTCTATCPGFLAIHVTVTTTGTFDLVSRLPGVPRSLTLTRSVTMRAQ